MLLRLNILFISFFVSASAFAELSKWDQFVKKADLIKIHACVYPDAPSHEAPEWVCSSLVQGMEVAAVGQGKYFEPEDGKEDAFVKKQNGNYRNFIPGPVKAYTDAMLNLDREINLQIRYMVKKYLESTNKSAEEKDKALSDIVKSVSALKSKSGKSQLTSMIKRYAETTKKGEEVISTFVSKVLHTSEGCQFVYKNFIESQGSGKNGKLSRSESNVHRGECGFGMLVDDMERSGYKLLKMIKSPNDNYYVLVGLSSVQSLLDKNIKKGGANESELWKQFKAK